MLSTRLALATVSICAVACGNCIGTTPEQTQGQPIQVKERPVPKDLSKLKVTKQPKPGPINLGPTVVPHRWFGLKKTSRQGCPSPKGGDQSQWKVFTFRSPRFTRGLSGKLSDVCIYEAIDFQKGAPREQLPFDSMLSMEPDRAVVASLSFKDQWLDYRNKETKHLFKRFKEPQAPKKGKFNQPDSYVRIAVVDSAAKWNKDGVVDQFGHGRAVGRVISNIGCPLGDVTDTAPCAAHLHNYLALPNTSPIGPPVGRGGGFGTLYTLANALDKAITEWLSIPVGERKRLIINLSLGWLPQGASKLQVGEEAILDHLRLARCHGALIVASSGNYVGGPVTQNGPMYPAAWASEPAPQDQQCLFKQGKLLVAVGGNTAQDEPLSITWPGSLPRQVAAASNITSRNWYTRPFYAGTFSPPVNPKTKVLPVRSGTSMAAAAFSGAASLVWTEKPSISPDEVAEIIYANSEATSASATYCPHPGPCTEKAHTLAVCPILSNICSGGSPGPMCNFLMPSCPTHAEVTPPAMQGFTKQTIKLSQTPYPRCGGEFYPKLNTPPVANCPFKSTPSLYHTPTVGPQPPEDPCDVCALLQGELYLSISNDYFPNYVLSNPMLQVLTNTGIKYFDLSGVNAPSGLHAGVTVVVQGLELPTGIISAQLSYVAVGPEGNFSGADEILLMD